MISIDFSRVFLLTCYFNVLTYLCQNIMLSLHLVLGLPCRLVHSRGDHSVTIVVHLLSLNSGSLVRQREG